ncbi:MAG: SMC family ATPase [Selenomonadaceae bacterium]|nr:SMC family ATPase [Selenomonadaceae bacterium]
MRPIKLKMSAFGPYVREIELDFVRGLNGGNFFLIHGATGAGKTTILDAICYALYGESSGGARKSSMLRSEQALPTVRTEVEFIFSLKGKIYRIVRGPKYERAKLRGGGTTEEKAFAEIYEDGEFVQTKDVTEYVRELLQFDSEQFRQVVVLPQGAFQKFLLAKSNEKQEVLNMLFDAEFFKRVEDELKVKAADAKRTFEDLDARKKNLLEELGAAEEELPALTEKLSGELEAALVQLKTSEARAAEAQKIFSDGENLSKLFKSFEARADELLSAEKALGKISGELSTAKIELDKRTAEESLREKLKLQAADLSAEKISLQKLNAKREELKAALAAAEKSSANVVRLKKLKTTCDGLMAQLKAEVEKFQDAPAKLKVAEQKLKDAKAREELLAEIKKLREKISSVERKLISAQKFYDAAEKNLADLRERQISGSAARLAMTLEEGKPCPVCGAIHHPQPATSAAAIPTDAQIKAAESKLRELTDEKSSAEKNLASLKRELEVKEKNLAEGAQVGTVAEARAECEELSAAEKTLVRDRTRIQNGEIKTRETEENLSEALEADKKISGEAEKLRGEVEAMTRAVDEKYLADEKLIDAEISATNKRLNELGAAFQTAQEKFNRLEKRLAAQKSTVEAAKKNKAEVAAQVEGKTLPDMPALKKILDEARAEERAAVEAKTKLSARIERLGEISKRISALAEDLKTADKNFLMWKTLADVAGGKVSRISFQRYYLSTMFKEVVVEANNRLEKMSGGRYRFRNKTEVTDKRSSGGLDLEILDDFTGTARPVETLSGGESFLASLSLALGLAAVVQNNSGGIQLDTIFIDEGFGSLDTETLDFAMKTLIELQSGGRLVGIISHVEELKNQMPVRLEVFKTKTGSFARFVS